MDAIRTRMLQLAQKGYQCSQILVILGLEVKGEENPELIKAAGGLAWGCGEGSCTCGALTAGCCILSLFAGKGTESEKWSQDFDKMTRDLVRWFWGKYGFNLQGIDCMAIREAGTPEKAQYLCWQIIEDVYFKVIALLTDGGLYLHPEGSYAS
jgi:hypothetical protein